MMVIISQNDMPADCVKCHEMGLRDIAKCELVYAGCANCGRHPHCPLKAVEELIDKIYDLDFDFGDYYVYTDKIQDMVIKTIKEYFGMKEVD